VKFTTQQLRSDALKFWEFPSLKSDESLCEPGGKYRSKMFGAYDDDDDDALCRWMKRLVCWGQFVGWIVNVSPATHCSSPRPTALHPYQSPARFVTHPSSYIFCRLNFHVIRGYAYTLNFAEWGTLPPLVRPKSSKERRRRCSWIYLILMGSVLRCE